MITRSQKYAINVYDKVNQMQNKTDEEKNKYGALAHRLPVLVRTAGLAQALAFADARAKDEELLKHLAEVLEKENKESLLEISKKAAISEYINLTTEVLTALTWFKRFSQSLLKVEPGEQLDGGGS